MYEWLDGYLLAKRGGEKYFKPEWNWWIYRVGGKSYADVGVDGEGRAIFVTFKLDPEKGRFLQRQYRAAAPGFYTNKELYTTVWFDVESVPGRDRLPAGEPPEGAAYPPDDLLRELADESYAMALARLTKKGREALLSGE